MIDEEVFAEATGVPLPRARKVWPCVLDAVNEFDITATRRLAAFIGQCSHETLNYTALREDTNYTTAEQIVLTFPCYFAEHDKEDPIFYTRQPRKLANHIYANRGGNGDADSGDGYRYRAGGHIGITFRDGYAWMQELLGVPLIEHPELIEHHELAARTAAAYWANTNWQGFNLNDFADDWNIRAISGLISRGNPNKTAIGLKDRMARCERALKVISKAIT